jgi:hypothetical protein
MKAAVIAASLVGEAHGQHDSDVYGNEHHKSRQA